MQSPVPAAPSPERIAATNPNVPPAARPPSALKGTMVGVAPPGMDDLRKQIAEARQNPDRTAVTSKLKGTMIGLAPPDLSAGDLQPTLLGVAPPSSSDPPPAGAPVAHSTAPHSTAAAHSSAATNPAPSRLKGTMVGVAPPDFGAAPGEFRPNVQSAEAFGGTVMAGGTAPMTAVAPAGAPFATAVTEPSPPPSEDEPALPQGLSGAGLSGAPRAATPEAVAGHRYATSSTGPSRISGSVKTNSSQLPILLLIGLIVVVALALVAVGFMMRGGGDEPQPSPAPAPATP